MKSTGITRKIDTLGRITIPKELCRTMKLLRNTPVEIYTEGDRIIIEVYQPDKKERV